MSLLNRLLQRKVSLEAQLEALAECGIQPKGGVAIDDFLFSFDREEYEGEPYKLLLCVLGGESEREPFHFLSDRVWHLDTECIEGPGDYVRIASRMAALAGNALPIKDIADHVDLEQGEAWLRFNLNGQIVNWDAAVDDDWIDPAIISRFAELLVSRSSSKRFTYLDLKGQDCIIGCSTPTELSLLRKRTGLDFTWLR